MRRTYATLALAVVMVLGTATVSLASDTSRGADFGKHHAGMATEMSGFTGEMNPGVHHQGFAGWGM